MKISYIKNLNLNTLEKAIFCAFIISILFSFMDFSAQCDSIKQKILRLHIIANSDSTEDQELKIKIRDRVLTDCSEYFDQNTNNINCAKETLQKNITNINSVAQDEVIKNGYDYKVNTYLTNSYFNVRNYNKITLPAGQYQALRIVLGDGNGKNWWCVMFPPICLGSAQESQEEQIEDVLTNSEADIVEGGEKYQVKFKIFEWFEMFRNWLYDLFCSDDTSL